jgi:ABC-type multidrug transport system fused ATPase/permease subunit
MSAAPPLLAGKRRGLALLLGLLALGEALLVVLFAAALDGVLGTPQAPMMPLMAAGGCAVMVAAALLLQRWVGEDFAQGFVGDCRAAIFTEVTRSPAAPAKQGADARWLTVLLNDMAALRNYALQGTVRLWTSSIAAAAATGWAALTMPQLRAALLPLMLGAGCIILLLVPLSRAIAAQRGARGRINRFLVRRVRVELSGAVSAKGHGFKKLASLSKELTHASVRRARSAGMIDAVAMLSGLAAALAAVWQAAQGVVGGAAGLAGGLTLLGFIAARLLEAARAMHARASGQIALARLARLLEPEAEALVRGARKAWAARWKRRVAVLLALPRPLARLPKPSGSPPNSGAEQELGA